MYKYHLSSVSNFGIVDGKFHGSSPGGVNKCLARCYSVPNQDDRGKILWFLFVSIVYPPLVAVVLSLRTLMKVNIRRVG